MQSCSKITQNILMNSHFSLALNIQNYLLYLFIQIINNLTNVVNKAVES